MDSERARHLEDEMREDALRERLERTSPPEKPIGECPYHGPYYVGAGCADCVREHLGPNP